MSSVDDRIVNMQFNNSQFTKGAADSTQALQGLEGQLTKTGQSQGIQQLGGAVDGIKTKFTALQVAGAAALGTIVSKATNVGLNLVKSLTLDPITQGFQEYQTNLNSIQTVVANTGKSVGVVNGYMQKLNTYSDQTIYNFSQMAHNIGTFTAAGVDLQTATASIQGIANLAALSGSSAEQASTAMYQLSQAIAAGRVGLQDWNSVVNAGLGGKQFQTSLVNTAVAMGDLNKSAVNLGNGMTKLTVNGNSFRQSISAAQGASSWLSSDVLVNTLAALDGRFSKVALGLNGYKGAAAEAQIAQARLTLEQKNGVKYSDEQFKALVKQADAAYKAATQIKSFPQLLNVVQESIGSIFSNSFAIILGDFNQSKKLWGAVGASITGPHGALTTLGTNWTAFLRSFVDTGGRTKILSTLGRGFKNLGKIFDALKGAFREVFPPASGKDITHLTKVVNELTRHLAIHQETVDNLKKIFGGFFAVLHIGVSIIVGIAKAFFNFFGALSSGADAGQSGILNLLGSVGQLLITLDKWLTSNGRLTDSIAMIGTIAGTALSPFVEAIGLAIKAVGALASGGGIDGLLSLFTTIGSSSSVLGHIINKNFSSIDQVMQRLSGPISKVTDSFYKLENAFHNISKSGFDTKTIFASIGQSVGQLAGGGLEIASGIIGGLSKGLQTAAPVIWAAIKELATGIIDGFKNALGIHSPSTEMIPVGLYTVQGIAEGMVKGFVFILKAIGKVGTAIKNAFLQLFGGMDALDVASFMNSIFTGAFLIALTNLSHGLNSPLQSINNVFKQLGNTLSTFQQGIKAKALLDIAAAVGVMVGSIVVLSLIDPKKIAISLGAIAAMIALLVGALAVLSKVAGGSLKLNALAFSLDLISASLVTLAAAVAIFGNMDMSTLEKGFGSVAIGLGLMVGALILLSKFAGGPIEGAAGSILVLSGAMVVLSLAIAALGNMDMKTLEKGLGAVAIGLGLMVGALVLLSSFAFGPIEGAAASILIMAGAMVVLAGAVAVFGNMDMTTLEKGLGSVAIGLTLMVGSLILLGAVAPSAIASAGAIYVVSKAMIALAIAVGLFGSMDMGTLAQGFGAVAVGLALILGAAALAQFVMPGLIALATVFLSLGAAMFLAGTGMALFATGFALLTATGVAGAAVLSAAISAFIALLPQIAVQVAASFVSFLETIAKAAPRIRAAMSAIFKEMIGVVTDAIPELQKLFAALIKAGLTTIRQAIPQYIETGRVIIDALLAAVAKEIPKIADHALQMIQDFLTVIDNHLPNIIDKGTDIIVHLLKGLGKAGERIIKATAAAILDILHAIDQAVVDNIDEFRNVGLSIAGHIIDGLTGGLISKGAGAVGGALGHLGIHTRTASGRGGNPLGQAQTAVNAALAASNALQSEQPSGAAFDAAQTASNAQKQADAKAAAAAIRQQEAAALAKLANKKGAGKGIKTKADQAQKAADKAAAAAQAAQDRADKIAQNAQDALDFSQGDLHQKGDILAGQAEDQASQASKLFQKAQAEKKRADDLAKSKNKKDQAERARLLKASQDDAAQAARLAKASQDSAAAARGYYADEVKARIDALNADAAAEKKAADDQAAYDAADQEGKAKIMEDRSKADQASADLAKAKAAQLIADAKALAATDPTAAMKKLDEAEKQAQDAKDLAQKAKDEADQAAQLAGQPGTSTGTGPTGGGIQPSRSVMEDAAKSFDRFSASLAQAEDLARAGDHVVQFNQVNNSPKALSPAEVYRSTKNLISAANVGVPVVPGTS